PVADDEGVGGEDGPRLPLRHRRRLGPREARGRGHGVLAGGERLVHVRHLDLERNAEAPQDEGAARRGRREDDQGRQGLRKNETTLASTASGPPGVLAT